MHQQAVPRMDTFPSGSEVTTRARVHPLVRRLATLHQVGMDPSLASFLIRSPDARCVSSKGREDASAPPPKPRSSRGLRCASRVATVRLGSGARGGLAEDARFSRTRSGARELVHAPSFPISRGSRREGSARDFFPPRIRALPTPLESAASERRVASAFPRESAGSDRGELRSFPSKHRLAETFRRFRSFRGNFAPLETEPTLPRSYRAMSRRS